MAGLAAEAFEAGAVGLSSGLIYVPGSYADTAELVALARVAARYGGVYATHMRDEGAHLEAALEEAVTIARTAGVRLQVSHCKAAGRAAHGMGGRLLARLAGARLDGVDAQGDQYPYDAGATVLSALLPPAVAAGGTEAMRARLRDPGTRAALRAQAERGGMGDGAWVEADPADILVTGHRDPGVAGRTLAEAAAGRDPGTRCVTWWPTTRRPPSSSASCARTTCGPSWPAPGRRRLRQRPPDRSDPPEDLGLLPPPARPLRPRAGRPHLGAGHPQGDLAGRPPVPPGRPGLLVEGAVADLCVFDPVTVGHDGTYLDPDVPTTGIRHVVLAGDLVVEDGRFTGRRSGRVLRGGRPGAAHPVR